MSVSRASTVLLAAPADVRAFLSEPHNLPDWWTGIGTVEPDRRGFSEGARWTVRSREASLFRRAGAEDTLLVHAAGAERFAFELVRARTHVELVLEAAGPDRTRADLIVRSPFSLGFSRGRVAAQALDRLYDRVQTRAALGPLDG